MSRTSKYSYIDILSGNCPFGCMCNVMDCSNAISELSCKFFVGYKRVNGNICCVCSHPPREPVPRNNPVQLMLFDS